MTWIRQPKWAEDLWYSVEQAVSEGVTPGQYRDEVAECWAEALRRRLEEEPKVFKDAK
jgi:hypothetical protein